MVVYVYEHGLCVFCQSEVPTCQVDAGDVTVHSALIDFQLIPIMKKNTLTSVQGTVLRVSGFLLLGDIAIGTTIIWLSYGIAIYA